MSIKWAYTGARSIDWNSYLDWSRNPLCPWCGMACQQFGDQHGPEDYLTISTILDCHNCGWWAAKQKTEEEGTFNGKPAILRGGRRYVAAVLKQFDPSDQRVPIQELRHYLIRNVSDIREIQPQTMEELVRSVYKDFLQCDVHYFTANTYSPDGGIDLAVVEGEHGIETAIQVKRRSREIAESVNTIRDFVGALAIEGYRKGIFVTTGRFSKDAQAIPTRLKTVFGDKVSLELVDAEGFEDLLRRTHHSSKKPHPWRRAIESYRYDQTVSWDFFLEEKDSPFA
jgi:hypothetical protein